MPYNAAPPPALHFDPRDLHDWDIASDGQWFLGILDTNSGIARFLPSKIGATNQVLPGRDPKGESDLGGAMPAYLSFSKPSETARRLNAQNVNAPIRNPPSPLPGDVNAQHKVGKLPVQWQSLPPDLRPGINWMSKEEYLQWKKETQETLAGSGWAAYNPDSQPAVQDHGRVIDFLGLNTDVCLGFTLVKVRREGQLWAVYIDKSKSSNEGKAGSRGNPVGGTHMPIAWNQAFVARFSADTEIPVERIDVSECAHATHTITFQPRAANV